MAEQNALWARYLNYKTGFNKTAADYISAYQSCGYQTGATDLVITDRTSQPPSGSAPPYQYTASNSISFVPSFESLTGDEFVAEIIAYTSGSGTALCSMDQSITSILMQDTAVVDPCQ